MDQQPFVKKITELIPEVSSLLINAKKMTLYHSRLLEIFIPIVELSSYKVAKVVK